MKIRIGSGKFRNRYIKSPNLKTTRVSTAYSKKVIFDTLQAQVEGAVVLDLFAGSGSLGIEALSRGARHVTFVENGAKPFATIKENLKSLDISESGKVTKQEVVKYLAHSPENKFDLIFIDPPYELEKQILNEILSTLIQNHLNEDGIICLEIPTSAKDQLIEMKISKKKIKGNTTLLFIQKE